MHREPIHVLQAVREDFEAKYEGVTTEITDTLAEDRTKIRMSLYFYYEGTPYYLYQLAYFDQPIGVENPYGFEVFGFQNPPQMVGMAENDEALESHLRSIFFSDRTQRILRQLQTIAEISGGDERRQA